MKWAKRYEATAAPRHQCNIWSHKEQQCVGLEECVLMRGLTPDKKAACCSPAFTITWLPTLAATTLTFANQRGVWQLHVLLTAWVPVITGPQRSLTSPTHNSVHLWPCSLKNFPEMQLVPPSPANSSLKLPGAPLSPLLLPPTDPSQFPSPTCILLLSTSSTPTTKPYFSAPMSYLAFTHREEKLNFPYATERP